MSRFVAPTFAAVALLAMVPAARADYTFTTFGTVTAPASLGFSNSTQTLLTTPGTGAPTYNFIDSWDFTLNPGADVGAFVGSLNFTDGNGVVTTGIDHLELRLWSYGLSTVVAGGAWQTISLPPNGQQAFSVIAPTGFAAGNYSLQVRGLTVGSVSSYGGNFTAMPSVPLPAAWPMLLAGLAVMGFIRRRGVSTPSDR
jgi:hypothetical protein